MAPPPLRETGTAAIETQALSLWYGGFQALKDVTVEGPSGCGKTTLLRCFNRVNERYGNVTTTGQVRLLGKDVHEPDVSLVELRKAVGMVFQRPNPLPLGL